MSDEGASSRELVLEACRRNNTELLNEVISSINTSNPKQSREDAVAELLNNSRDGMGNTPLHVAARAGSYEVLDLLLDQPGVETDPLTRKDGETPLHLAVAYVNSQFSPSPATSYIPSRNFNGPNSTPPPPPSAPPPPTDPDESSNAIVEILLDAGCDPRIRNKANMKPVDCVDRANEELRSLLRRAEFMIIEGENIVDDDEESEGGEGPPSDDE